jgi:hypothetical protein
VLEPSRSLNAGAWRGSHYRAEENFNLNIFQIAVLKLEDLIKTLLANCRFGLFKGFVLTLDNCPAHGALALFVALDASIEGHIKKYQSGRHLLFLRQVEQVLPRLNGQRRRVNHAEPVQRKPLF